MSWEVPFSTNTLKSVESRQKKSTNTVFWLTVSDVNLAMMCKIITNSGHVPLMWSYHHIRITDTGNPCRLQCRFNGTPNWYLLFDLQYRVYDTNKNCLSSKVHKPIVIPPTLSVASSDIITLFQGATQHLEINNLHGTITMSFYNQSVLQVR